MVPSDRPRHSAEVHCATFDDEILLYDPQRATGLWLNETASLVWRLCDGQRTVGEIVAFLQGAYPSAAEHLPAEVNDTLSPPARFTAPRGSFRSPRITRCKSSRPIRPAKSALIRLRCRSILPSVRP